MILKTTINTIGLESVHEDRSGKLYEVLMHTFYAEDAIYAIKLSSALAERVEKCSILITLPDDDSSNGEEDAKIYVLPPDFIQPAISNGAAD